jgi:hypothetical protein
LRQLNCNNKRHVRTRHAYGGRNVVAESAAAKSRSGNSPLSSVFGERLVATRGNGGCEMAGPSILLDPKTFTAPQTQRQPYVRVADAARNLKRT